MTQEEYLAHHGILGQRWGVRRYQNADGTLTNAGKKRYAKSIAKATSLDEASKIARNNVSPSATKALRSKHEAWSTAQSKVDEMEQSQEFKKLEKAARSEARESVKKQIKDDFDLADYNFNELVNDEYWEGGFRDSLELAYRKKNPKYDAALKEVDRTWKEYDEASEKFVDDLVGKYGKMKMKNLPDWQKRITVRNVVYNLEYS